MRGRSRGTRARLLPLHPPEDGVFLYVGFVSKGYFQHLREHLLREIVEREADYLRQRRIIAMTRSRSESVMAVPEGRHRPRLNKSSATSPPTTHMRRGKE